MTNYAEMIAGELAIRTPQVQNTIKLLDEGGTIPFISRYRKEMTGSLDEVWIGDIQERYVRYKDVDKRREAIIKSIEEQDKMTPELKKKLEASWSMTELEDLYLPYKPKRKTRGSVAIAKGLEPLAIILLKQQDNNLDAIAAKFLNDDVADVKEALQGARDIIAELASENIKARDIVRDEFGKSAQLTSKLVKGKEEEGDKYRDYFEFSQELSKAPSHRLFAIWRGEKEGVLKASIAPQTDKVNRRLEGFFVKGRSEAAEQVRTAVKDAYKRLLAPSIANEYTKLSREKADDEAIGVFEENLRQLLLAAPLGQKKVLAIDPGFRSGCKIVCLDESGDLMHNETIYPNKPQEDTKMAAKKLHAIINTYKIDAVAIGNGTASRETEGFIRSKIKPERDIKVFVVSEDGASVYSASKIARDEFPQYDVTVRGSVSIGRRLMDPLAELVKIDPKSMGVGQYQHDVDQKKLQQKLDQLTESCVNLVGVNLNTASKHILTYVSGLGPVVAQNIVDYRGENGLFSSRKELKKVARMGDKAYEQCAGFLRIPDAKNPLDNSAVHPESYAVVKKMAVDMGCEISDLMKDEELRKDIELSKYISGDIGLPTLEDIMKELEKPGRDPRKIIKVFEFDPNVRNIEDLIPGMILPGIISNITNFGCFVDVGVKEDGLVHISQLANKYVSNPAEVVKLHQHVKVKVKEVDLDRKRIGLSMKDVEE